MSDVVALVDQHSVEKPKLELRKFDPDSMPDNSMVVLVAQSEGGKTTMALDLLWHKRHLPAFFLFSESEGCSSRLRQCIAPSYTYPEFDKNQLEKIYNYQQGKIQRYSRPRSEADRRLVPDDELSMEERFFKNPCVGAYFEDCFGEKKIFNQKIVQNLFKNGRHRMMFTIIPCQYIIDLPPTCRKQIKYIFLFREDSRDVRRKLFEHVAGACKSFDIFEEIMKLTLQPYVCIVIDNICKSKKIVDRVFWYKADLHPAFKVGCANYWRFHKLNYKGDKEVNPDEEDARRRLQMAKQMKKSSRARNRREKVPPPLVGANHAAMASDGAAYLHTPSMMEAYDRGIEDIEYLMDGPRKPAKFNVVMRGTTY